MAFAEHRPTEIVDAELLGGQYGPERQAEAADFRRHLEEALRDVAEPYRSIVILREIEQLQYEEIATAMAMPLNTVKVYLHRGRRMLRTKLREFVEP